jgi:iron complex outermembrane receptor protein
MPIHDTALRALYFLFISFILSVPAVVAQNNTGSLKGRVVAPDGSSVFATVELKKLRKLTTTDNDGRFTFRNLPSVSDTLVIHSLQSNVLSMEVILTGGETVDLGKISLTFSMEELQRVEVLGRTSRSFKSDYSYLSTKTQTPLLDVSQAISTITKEKIMDKMDFTLKDAVDDAAGVNDYSGYDEYTIRGFLADNARLINGLRGYNTTYTSPLLVNIERIEVVKGPTATLYGNCDPGGNINLVTKKPLSTPEAEINVFAGTWDHFRAEGDITGPLNNSKTLLYRFNAGYDNTRSFRNPLFAKSFELAPSFSFIPNDKIQVNVDFSVSHINTILDRGQPGFETDTTLKSTPISLMVAQPGDYLHETDLATSVLFSYKINPHISFNSGYLSYITQQDVADHGVQGYITNDSVDLYYSNWTYHTVTNTLTNYLTFQFNTGRLNHQFLVGYDYVNSNVNLNQNYYELPNQFGAGSGIVGTFSLSNPQYPVPPTSQYQLSSYDADASDVDASQYTTQGVYVQEQINWNKFKWLIGLREEYYNAGTESDSSQEDQVNIFLPRIGLVYTLTPNASLYGTYNKGFDPFEASASTQIFDEPFKPVTSQLLEVGAKANWLTNKLSTTLSIYQLTLQNVAVNANVISNPNLFVQQGEDRSRGIEAEANGYVLPGLSISLSYAYCDAQVVQSLTAEQIGTRVENAPLHSSSSLIKYTFTKGFLKGFGLLAGHLQASARNTLAPGITLRGYFVVNTGLHYTRNHFTIAVNWNNIGNERYWVGAYNLVNKWPGAPRNAMVRVGYSF